VQREEKKKLGGKVAGLAGVCESASEPSMKKFRAAEVPYVIGWMSQKAWPWAGE